MNAFRSLLPRSSIFYLPVVLASTLGLAAPGLAAEQPADNWVSTLGVNGAAHAVARDSAGNVIAAGHQQSGPLVNDTHFAVAKWSAAGELLWQRRLETPSPSGDRALAVQVDRDDNVVAAGYVTNGAGRRQLTVLKWNPAGELLWSRPISESFGRTIYAPNPAASLALGSDGSAFVAGSAGPYEFRRIGVVARVSPRGEVTWLYRHNVGSSQLEEFTRVVLDRRGDVYVAGSPGPWLLFKLDGKTGSRRWASPFAGSFSWSDTPESLAVDRQGNVILCGMAHGRGGGWSLQFAVMRFSGSSGKRLWERFFGYGTAYSVAIGPKGEIAVGGSFGGHDFTVLKLSASRGELVWIRQFFGRPALYSAGAKSVAFGPRGQITAGGRLNGSLTNGDALVATWDARGNLLWKQRLTSEVGAALNDEAEAIAVGSDGRVAVAGVLGAGSPPGFAGALLDGWHTQPKEVQWASDAVPAGQGTATLHAAVAAPEAISEVSGSMVWGHATWPPLKTTPLPTMVEPEGRLLGSTPFPSDFPFSSYLSFGRPLLLTRDLAGVLRIEDGPLLGITPAASGMLLPSSWSLKFPPTRAGKFRSLTLTFQNTGPTPLQMALDLRLGGPFGWQIIDRPHFPGADWPSTIHLNPGSSTSITVSFYPPGRGSFSGALQVWSSDPSRSRITIPITGKGQ